MIKKSLIAVCVLFSMFSLVYAFNDTNSTGNEIGLPENLTLNISDNITNVFAPTLAIKNFFPTDAKVGDVQLNINVQNLGEVELNNLGAYVSGNGFSSYDVVPIDSLKPTEKSYIIVSGNFKNSGNINLTIKINQEVFYKIVNVADSSIAASTQNEALKANLTTQLAELKQNYALLESAIQIKKSAGYDVSGINLDDLKNMLRDTQANLLSGNIEQSAVKYDLALEEYNIQNDKIDKLKKVSLGARLRENAVLFSTLAGAIITFFTLYELLKKKKEAVKEKITNISKKKK